MAVLACEARPHCSCTPGLPFPCTARPRPALTLAIVVRGATQAVDVVLLLLEAALPLLLLVVRLRQLSLRQLSIQLVPLLILVLLSKLARQVAWPPPPPPPAPADAARRGAAVGLRARRRRVRRDGWQRRLGAAAAAAAAAAGGAPPLRLRRCIAIPSVIIDACRRNEPECMVSIELMAPALMAAAAQRRRPASPHSWTAVLAHPQHDGIYGSGGVAG